MLEIAPATSRVKADLYDLSFSSLLCVACPTAKMEMGVARLIGVTVFETNSQALSADALGGELILSSHFMSLFCAKETEHPKNRKARHLRTLCFTFKRDYYWQQGVLGITIKVMRKHK